MWQQLSTYSHTISDGLQLKSLFETIFDEVQASIGLYPTFLSYRSGQ